jgi:hypothetical protein
MGCQILGYCFGMHREIYTQKPPLGKYLDKKNIINVHSFNIKPRKTLIGKSWKKSSKETISLPQLCVSRYRFEFVKTHHSPLLTLHSNTYGGVTSE